MALLQLARSATAAAASPSARLLLHRFLCPPSSLPARLRLFPTLSSPGYAFSSAALPPVHPHFSLEDAHNRFLESSDLEDEPDEPTDSACRPELRAVLEIISKARGQSPSKEEALRLLRASGVELTGSLVSSAIWKLRGDWESAILAFQWGEGCLSSCPRAWHRMIWVLARKDKLEIAWLLVRQMSRLSILTQRPLIILMERYAATDRPEKAIKTFHAMEKFKITANSTAFYALLRALCKHRNVEEAEQLLFSNQKFFPLETESFNIILDGWCNIIVDLVEAKRLWREMSSSCINPDGTSYTNMICCFSKGGNLFDSMRLYDEMRKRGWVPGLPVYNALIYVLTREKCVTEAKKLFDKIEEEGLKANVDTYNSIIFPLAEAQNLEEARYLLENMIEKGLTPTMETYHAFARIVDMEGTLKLIKRMSDVGCGPNRYTFLLILEKFFKLDQAGNALRIWKEMKRYGTNPHETHYAALIQGLASCGWIPKAVEFYNEMESKRLHVDPNIKKLMKNISSRNKNKQGWGR